MRYANYSEYLKSDRWRRLRARAFIRDDNKCQVCGAGADCVHHMKYHREWGKEPIDWLISLCEKCHDEFHAVHGSAPGRSFSWNQNIMREAAGGKFWREKHKPTKKKRTKAPWGMVRNCYGELDPDEKAQYRHDEAKKFLDKYGICYTEDGLELIIHCMGHVLRTSGVAGNSTIDGEHIRVGYKNAIMALFGMVQNYDIEEETQ